MIQAKAIDDRFGCLVLIELLKSDLEYDVDVAFVVQEEVGLHGAKTAAYTLDPQFALVVETTTAADIPEIDSSKQVCQLGEGAVISVMDRRTIYDKEMVRLAFAAAAEIGVKAQYKRAVAGGNDAGVIHQSSGGVRTLAVSLACRYLHAPSCVADKDDCESVMALVRELATPNRGRRLTGRVSMIQSANEAVDFDAAIHALEADDPFACRIDFTLPLLSAAACFCGLLADSRR